MNGDIHVRFCERFGGEIPLTYSINKWNAGEPDTNKVAAAWFGSCVFLVIVATVLKSFFGL